MNLPEDYDLNLELSKLCAEIHCFNLAAVSNKRPFYSDQWAKDCKNEALILKKRIQLINGD